MFGFGGPKKKNPNGVPISLDEVIAVFGQATTFWQSLTSPDSLAGARFGDCCRKVGVVPVNFSRFQENWKSFNPEECMRFCISLSALDLEPVVSQLETHCGKERDASVPLNVLTGNAKKLKLLTAQLLSESDVRLEEFSRHFCSAWEMAIEGETFDQSQARLNEIDFERLMKGVEDARLSAAERMEYLKKMQEEQDQLRRPRRGKW